MEVDRLFDFTPAGGLRLGQSIDVTSKHVSVIGFAGEVTFADGTV